ncbi:MAG: chromosome segregation protein SMC [Chloroflexota bacterium]|jgi:predicted ATPase|nr:AAA family ATPase [Caldilinea sp.]GIK74260.1 MAG: chromosome segregation protein SMC [Chloroflexota bacterium]
MSALNAITIQGFRSIADVEKLELRPINVLIGPNGSGKSNFIAVFAFLNAIRDGKLQDYVARAGGADRLLHFGSKITPAIVLHVFFRDDTNQYRIVLTPTETDQLFPNGEHVYFWDRDKYSERPYAERLAARGLEAGISDPDRGGTAQYVRKLLASWRLYHFHDTSAMSPLKKTGDINDNRFLRPDGSNLAAFLYLLRQKHLSTYNMICRTVQRVAPFFDDFVLEPLRLNPDKIRLEWRHRGADAYFDVASLSDGTLRFIALATLLLQPEEYRPSVILVDEPELGLHPYAITLLASLIKQVSHTTQVILSTQSPLLLDHFEPEDVLVAERANGSTQFTRLDADRLAIWLEEYSLGQLWEKNELGGRPAPEGVYG